MFVVLFPKNCTAKTGTKSKKLRDFSGTFLPCGILLLFSCISYHSFHRALCSLTVTTAIMISLSAVYRYSPTYNIW
jgi:general stress protein CsbA